MKYTKLRLSRPGTDAFDTDFPIIGAEQSDPYVLRNVDGLGPPDITVTISDTPYEGGIYQNAHPTLREIVMLVGLNPNYTTGESAADLRQDLYWAVDPLDGIGVDVQIMDGETLQCHTIGYISKFETVPFSNDPQVQITISCNSAYLFGPQIVADVGDGDEVTVSNPGNASAPFDIEFTLTAATYGNVNLYVTTDSTNEYMEFDYDSWASGDEIEINTTPGQKVAKITSPSEQSIVGYLDPDSDWLTLPPSTDSTLSVTTGNPGTITSLVFTPRYWGI